MKGVDKGSAFAAVVLFFGILGLFIRLQEYGPESALRKFHQALVTGSATDLQRVTLEDVRSPAVSAIAGRIQVVLRLSGGRFRILRTDRTPAEVRAVVAYSLPNGASTSMVWVVDRDGRTWRVSIEKTEQVLRDAFGL